MTIILIMIFLHILADFNLQGFMADGKQKGWWEKNSPGMMYRYDYISILLMHSFMWTFMIMIPLAFCFGIDTTLIVLFFLNFIIHSFIDNAKANWKCINLITDQTIHIIQIILTYLFISIKIYGV